MSSFDDDYKDLVDSNSRDRNITTLGPGGRAKFRRQSHVSLSNASLPPYTDDPHEMSKSSLSNASLPPYEMTLKKSPRSNEDDSLDNVDMIESDEMSFKIMSGILSDLLDEKLSKIQKGEYLKAKMNNDAIEEAKDTITSRQICNGISNSLEFSSLQQRVHQMSSRMEDIANTNTKILEALCALQGGSTETTSTTGIPIQIPPHSATMKVVETVEDLKSTLPKLVVDTLRSTYSQHLIDTQEANSDEKQSVKSIISSVQSPNQSPNLSPNQSPNTLDFPPSPIPAHPIQDTVRTLHQDVVMESMNRIGESLDRKMDSVLDSVLTNLNQINKQNSGLQGAMNTIHDHLHSDDGIQKLEEHLIENGEVIKNIQKQLENREENQFQKPMESLDLSQETGSRESRFIDRSQVTRSQPNEPIDFEETMESKMMISQIINRLESKLEDEQREHMQYEQESIDFRTSRDQKDKQNEDDSKFMSFDPSASLYVLLQSEISKLSMKMDDISMNVDQMNQNNDRNFNKNIQTVFSDEISQKLDEITTLISGTVQHFEISDEISQKLDPAFLDHIASSISTFNQHPQSEDQMNESDGVLTNEVITNGVITNEALLSLSSKQIELIEELPGKLDAITSKLDTQSNISQVLDALLQTLNHIVSGVDSIKSGDCKLVNTSTTNVCWQPSEEEEICGINRIANLVQEHLTHSAEQLEQHLAGSPTTEDVVSGIKEAANQSEKYFTEYMTTLKEEILQQTMKQTQETLQQTKSLLKESVDQHFENTKTLFDAARLLHFSSMDSKFMHFASTHYAEVTEWRHEIASNILKIEQQINVKNRDIGNISVVLGQIKSARIEQEEFAVPTKKILSDIKSKMDKMGGEVREEVAVQMDLYRNVFQTELNKKWTKMQRDLMSRPVVCEGPGSDWSVKEKKKERRETMQSCDSGGNMGGDAVDEIVKRIDRSMKMYLGEVTASQTHLVNGLVDKVWQGMHEMMKSYLKGLAGDLIGRLEAYQKSIDFRIQLVGDQVEGLHGTNGFMHSSKSKGSRTSAGVQDGNGIDEKS